MNTFTIRHDQRNAILNAMALAIRALDDLRQQFAALNEVRPDPSPVPASPLVETAIRVGEWLSPCPAGYNTIVGWLAMYRPGVLAWMTKPEQTLRMGFKIRHYIRRLPAGSLAGERPVPMKVAAPEAFREYGIEEINAYPDWILFEVLGEGYDAGQEEGR